MYKALLVALLFGIIVFILSMVQSEGGNYGYFWLVGVAIAIGLVVGIAMNKSAEKAIKSYDEPYNFFKR